MGSGQVGESGQGVTCSKPHLLRQDECWRSARHDYHRTICSLCAVPSQRLLASPGQSLRRTGESAEAGALLSLVGPWTGTSDDHGWPSVFGFQHSEHRSVDWKITSQQQRRDAWPSLHWHVRHVKMFVSPLACSVCPSSDGTTCSLVKNRPQRHAREAVMGKLVVC